MNPEGIDEAAMSNYRDYQSTSYNPLGGDNADHNGDFGKLAQIVAQNIQKLSSHTNQMQSMVNQIGTPNDNENLRQQSHKIQHYANQIAKETNKYLKDLASIPTPVNVSEQKQRRMQKEKLTNEFTEALKNFQVIQRTSAQKEKESVIRARANSGINNFPALNNKPSSTLIDLQTPDGSEQPAFGNTSGRQQQTHVQIEEEVNLTVLRERENAIRKIESDIVEVNQIFKDLAGMVHEQGSMIDSIEGNIESSSVQIHQGTTELSKASEYSRKARQKKFCLILVLFAILGVIGLIIYVNSK